MTPDVQSSVREKTMSQNRSSVIGQLKCLIEMHVAAGPMKDALWSMVNALHVQHAPQAPVLPPPFTTKGSNDGNETHRHVSPESSGRRTDLHAAGTGQVGARAGASVGERSGEVGLSTGEVQRGATIGRSDGDVADTQDAGLVSPPPSPFGGPIPLNEAQEHAVKDWAADDRLWTTQETVEINLRTFARTILKETPEWRAVIDRSEPVNVAAGDRSQPIVEPHEATGESPRCIWTQDGHGSDTWEAGCGKDRLFCFDDEGPEDSGFRHCPYCGHPLTQLSAEELEVLDGE